MGHVAAIATFVLLGAFCVQADNFLGEYIPKECTPKHFKLKECGGGPFIKLHGGGHKICVFVSDVTLNFKDASDFCGARKGQLVEVRNKALGKLLSCLVRRQTKLDPTFWLGAKRLSNGEHVWLSKQTTPIRWAPGQPDFYKERESCVEMNWGGELESDEYVDIKKKKNLESLTI